MPDQWEIAHGLDPAADDAHEDWDGDGFPNIVEYQDGTDPRDARSNPPAPVAHAGQDRSVLTGSPVKLDGSGSFLPGEGLLRFLWSFVEVPAGSRVTDASLTEPAGVQPAFQPDRDGIYRLRLRVVSGPLSGQAEVTITASPAGYAGPNADAGPDRNAVTGSKVVLDGRRSYDPDRGPGALSFTWTLRSVPMGSVHEGET